MKLQREGWILHGNIYCLMNKDQTITFDIKIPTAKGMLYAMYHQCGTEVANAGTQAEETETTKTLSITIGKAHNILGHQSEFTARNMPQ
jgi:hypothetical protein